MTVSRSMTHNILPVASVQQDVVDLGVVVSDPLRQPALLLQAGQNPDQRLAGPGESDLFPGVAGSIPRVPLQRRLELPVTVFRVVEAGYGLVKTRGRQIQEQFLEAPESAGRLIGHPGRGDGVVDRSAFDEVVGAPVVPVGILIEAGAGDCRHQGQGTAAQVLDSGLPQLVLEMPGDSLNVPHEGGRIPEDPLVDSLMDVAPAMPPIPVAGQVGVVDVAVPVGQNPNQFAVHCETRADGCEFLLLLPVHTRALREPRRQSPRIPTSFRADRLGGPDVRM